MVSMRRKILLNSMKLFDMLGITAAFFLGALLASYKIGPVSFADFLSMRIKILNFVVYIGFLFLCRMIFSSLGLYSSKRFSSRGKEIIDVVKASFIGTVIIAITAVVFKISLVTPFFLLVFWISSSLIISLSRYLLRSILAKLRIQGRNLRFMLIVGTNRRAIQFARKIELKPELGYRIIGFADNEYAQNGDFRNLAYSHVTDFNGFPEFIRNHVVDEVIMSLPIKSLYEKASQIVRLCEEQGITVRFLSDIFDLKLGHLKAEQFEEDSMITVSTGNIKGMPVIMKRAHDFLASLILLLICVPPFLVISMLIKFTSPGTVFFIQERVGLNKRRFRLYKFRTMVPGAEKKQAELEQFNEVKGPVFKIKEDPRITRIGKLLRKSSLDELPQFINVLKGDMSIVGPRPLPVRDYEGFDEDWHRRRFSVRPGITCLWQISGRNGIPFEKWMQLDMDYIDNWSLKLDFEILIKTIPAVLKGSGAA